MRCGPLGWGGKGTYASAGNAGGDLDEAGFLPKLRDGGFDDVKRTCLGRWIMGPWAHVARMAWWNYVACT